MIVGVISDTHGRLDPAVEALFAGVDHVIHVGDVGGQAIIEVLLALAPLTVVGGNCDKDPWGKSLPDSTTVVLDGVTVLVGHDRVMLEALGVPLLHQVIQAHSGAVVYGHTHVAEVNTEHGVLYLNPGSASLPRYELPRSVALLRIEKGVCTAKIHRLGWDMLL